MICPFCSQCALLARCVCVGAEFSALVLAAFVGWVEKGKVSTLFSGAVEGGVNLSDPKPLAVQTMEQWYLIVYCLALNFRLKILSWIVYKTSINNPISLWFWQCLEKMHRCSETPLRRFYS